MFAQLCKCNNCDNILIDKNPQINAPEIKLTGNELEMIELSKEGEKYWGCPICLTDEFLVDLPESK